MLPGLCFCRDTAANTNTVSLFDINWKANHSRETRPAMPANRVPLPSAALPATPVSPRLAQLAVFEHFASRLDEIEVTPAIFGARGAAAERGITSRSWLRRSA